MSGVSVVRDHTPEGLLLSGVALGCRKGGIPSHGFEDSLFCYVLSQTKVDKRFKIYANRCYWEADRLLNEL